MKVIEQCGICLVPDLEPVWLLPGLPLTERFGPYDPANRLAFDQILVICRNCGHIQLQNQLPAATLYAHDSYSFRTGESKTAQAGAEVFLDFVNETTGGRWFESILDLGGNDLYLARKFEGRARHRTVIDPICSALDGSVVDGISVIGRMVEMVDLSQSLVPPDFVVCRHTLEHISQPRELMEQLFAQCAPECLYIFEIPCFEGLVESQRFDAIFHQHYHYYNLLSLRRLLEETGGEYLAHRYNWSGSCGGSLLIAFRKGGSGLVDSHADGAMCRHYVSTRIDLFRSQMETMARILDDLPGPVFGYGASLMLATLAYHLKTDFCMLECILDDDSRKNGWAYKNVPVRVQYTGQLSLPSNASYIVTSLENVRPIFGRILEFAPRHVLVPLLV